MMQSGMVKQSVDFTSSSVKAFDGTINEKCYVDYKTLIKYLSIVSLSTYFLSLQTKSPNAQCVLC